MLTYTISGNKADKFREQLKISNIRYTTERGLFGFIVFKVYSKNNKLTSLLFHTSRKK